MHLGIDCDGVLYDFVEAFKSYYCDIKHLDSSKFITPTGWGFFEEWGIPMWEFKEMYRQGVRDGIILWQGKPIDGAVEALTNLSQDHQITIITHRNLQGMEEMCLQATKSWLNFYHIPYDDIILTDEKTGLVDLLLDDGIHNVKASLDVGERAVLFDRSTNQDVDYPRVYNWSDFERYVERLDAEIKTSC